jgi:hypothetical protein
MNDTNTGTRNHSTLVFVGVLLAVLLIVGTVSMLQTYVTSTGGPTTSTASAGPCSESVLPFNASGMEVFQLTPGSSGSICVSYGFQGTGTYSFSASFGPLFNQSDAYYACSYEFNIEAVANRCSGVRIMPSVPYVINFPGQNVTIAYTVQTNLNATGLFWLFIASCDPVVLVFGPLPASVPGPVFLGCVTSLDSPSAVNVTGVSNVSVAAVPTG